MKLIIAGSRTITMEPLDIENSLREHIINPRLEIISGTANGMDKSGEKYAKTYGHSLKKFPANWSKHGRSAGYKRNVIMGKYADALFLVWDGESKGSGHMKAIMQKLNKPIYEVIIQKGEKYDI